MAKGQAPHPGSWRFEGSDDTWELRRMPISRRPRLMLGPSLTVLAPPRQPKQVPEEDDLEVLEPCSNDEDQASLREKQSVPESPGMATTCPPSTSLGCDTPGLESTGFPVPFEPDPASKSSTFCSSWDSRPIGHHYPDDVALPPDRRTHQLYVRFLDQYLEDVQDDQRGFKGAVPWGPN
ncbi:unnamed protein product [Symbiodinium natans]|uniref:Uncharacterized protein n=1 Tax=Symbiodinium natans TaxID=878477 RepID=A0A812LPG0_9DINO|nr:unnamed protein product [Symbiodinium natans]